MRHLALLLLLGCQAPPEAILPLPESDSASRAEASVPRQIAKGRIPDVPLVSHTGQSLHFYTDLVRDRCVVIQFLYTNCESVCPPATARLMELQSKLPPDVRLISVTLDPERDTPTALAAFAERLSCGPQWTFLTGQLEDIELLRRKLGEQFIEDVDPAKPLLHSSLYVLGNDRSGEWRALSSQLSAERLLSAVETLCASRPGSGQ
ncbi:MAG: SCO family protein [Planctomycetia bacterium]